VPTSSSQVDPPAPAQTDPRVRAPQSAKQRVWDDAPLRHKLALLIVLATVGGIAIGLLEAQLGHRFYPMILGGLLVVLCLCSLSDHWIWGPFSKLFARIRQVVVRHRPGPLETLAAERRDEVGQLARAMLQVAVSATRNRQEAGRLRRTLDHRVQEATRKATVRLQQIAMRDSLTELGNRRFLDDNLAPLVDSCREAKLELQCIALDMDNFKHVNDTLGHDRGDELLVFFGSLIRCSVREEDYAIRLGGDEFVILMPAADRPAAARVANRLVQLFDQHARVTLPRDMKTGISAGIASLVADRCQDGPTLLKRADERLYDAKDGGKGRVVTE